MEILNCLRRNRNEKTLPEKFIKEPTGFPFSPVLSIEGKEIVVTSGTCCDDYDGQIPEDMETQNG